MAVRHRGFVPALCQEPPAPAPKVHPPRPQLDILENNVAAGAPISLYRCGPMVDLCRGPHVPNTSYLKAVAVTNASRAFWRGDTSKDGLQRVYGVTFPDKKQLAGALRSTSVAGSTDRRRRTCLWTMLSASGGVHVTDCASSSVC